MLPLYGVLVMAELWRQLKTGDRIRLIELPPEFAAEGYFLHPETRRVYQRLLARGRALRVCEVKRGGPWIHCKFRRRNGQWESHWLLFNHGGIVRVKRRGKSPPAQTDLPAPRRGRQRGPDAH